MARKRIGYAKIGRSYNLDPNKATSIGGDIDVLNALRRLAETHPDYDIVLVGKNSGENPQEFGYPSNIINPWTEWKEHWMVVPNPEQADSMIEHFRKIAGDYHTTLDHMVVWAGQHGSANSRIPMIGSDWTRIPGAYEVFDQQDPTNHIGVDNVANDIITGGDGILATPQFAFVHYISWLLDFISRWRESGPGPLYREEVWLCPDPRNYLKCREKRWPLRLPVLAQYDFLRYHKGERYGRFPDTLSRLDPTGYRENSLWVSNVAYCYSGLELTAVGNPEAVAFDPRPGPHRFGMVVNENLQGVKDNRLALLKSWILPNFPDAEIRGHWTEKSQLDLQRIIEPVPYTEVLSTMKSFATTITTPASGSEWATAKPWESFAIGSVCFFHPRYDGQGHILPLKDGTAGHAVVSEDSKMLAEFLRVDSPEQLKERVDRVTSNPDLYHVIVHAQRRHYEASFKRWNGGIKAISERLEHDLEREEAGVSIPDGPEIANKPWLSWTEVPAAKVQSRGEARPRGTNEERKKRKPPVSRRRALKGLPQEDVVETVENAETAVEASIPDTDYVSAETVGATDTYSFDKLTPTPAVRFDTVPVVWAQRVDPMKFSTAKMVDPSKFLHSPINYVGPEKSEERWPRRFLALAEVIAAWSKDPSTKCGAVATDDDNNVIGVGYNGFPDRIEDKPEWLNDRDQKRKLVIHAEMNLVFNSAVKLKGKHVYATHPCCGECAKMLIGAGIASFTAWEVDEAFKGRWNCDEAARVFELAGVPYRLLKR